MAYMTNIHDGIAENGDKKEEKTRRGQAEQ